MKSYTDIEQSKKLAEILSIETADHHYVRKTCDFMGNPVDGEWSQPHYGNPNSKYANYFVQNFSSYEKLPCWSLTALIELMDECRMERTPLDQSGVFTHSFVDDYFNIRTYEEYDIVDAAVEMILILKEKGLL